MKHLKVVDDQGWALMREGEAEKQVSLITPMIVYAFLNSLSFVTCKALCLV